MRSAISWGERRLHVAKISRRGYWQYDVNTERHWITFYDAWTIGSLLWRVPPVHFKCGQRSPWALIGNYLLGSFRKLGWSTAETLWSAKRFSKNCMDPIAMTFRRHRDEKLMLDPSHLFAMSQSVDSILRIHLWLLFYDNDNNFCCLVQNTPHLFCIRVPNLPWQHFMHHRNVCGHNLSFS